MNYRRLPKTDLEVSEIGFGCMSLRPEEGLHKTLLRSAFDRGINYFDTADLYDRGMNESLVGDSVKPFRHQVVLATKVGNEWLPDGSGWRWNPQKAYIIQAVEKSLKRLQTDYIDNYQLHGGTIDDSMEEVIEAFEALVEAGKIRYYGLSSIRPNVIRPYAAHAGIVSNMLQYSLLDRRPEEAVLEYLRQQKVGVMVRGALAKGLLAGKPVTSYLNHEKQEVQALITTLEVLSDEHRNAGQLAIRYVLEHPAVTSVVVGIHSHGQLEAAVRASGVILSPPEMTLLSQTIKADRYVDHR